MATNKNTSERIENILSSLSSQLANASTKQREPTIFAKLRAMAEKVFMLDSKYKLMNNMDFPVPSLEYVIPIFSTELPHNYILFDSLRMLAVTDEEIKTIYTRRPGVNDEEYKKIFHYFNERLLPYDVWEELSKLSDRLLYDDHIIVLLKNIKYAEFSNRFDSTNPQPDIFLQHRLVKIKDLKKVQHSINVPAENLFIGQCSCLDPNIQGAQVESIFDEFNKNNKKCAKDKQHKVTNCPEKSLENNSENIYSACPMALLLAARSSSISKMSRFSRMSIVEKFLFEYCEGVNQSITSKKVLCVAKAQAGYFCITEVEADNQYSDENFQNETVEIENQSEVDRLIHLVYHNYLNECSSQITVHHKASGDEYQKIFSITFPEGTKKSHFSEADTSFEEKTAEQTKETPEDFSIHIKYAEVPEENSLQGKEGISKETDKPKQVPFDDVYGWFKGKEKHGFQLKAGVEHLRECKEEKRHILLNLDDDVKNELNRLKRMLDEEKDPATEQISKKRKIDDSIEVDDNSSNDNPNGEKSPYSHNDAVTCDTNFMEVDEISSNDSFSGEKTADTHINDESDFSIFGLTKPVDIFESTSNVYQRETKKKSPLEQILDKCLNNKKQLTSQG